MLMICSFCLLTSVMFANSEIPDVDAQKKPPREERLERSCGIQKTNPYFMETYNLLLKLQED
jgi:hypothetical protein